jgi:hypothetical protein
LSVMSLELCYLESLIRKLAWPNLLA